MSCKVLGKMCYLSGDRLPVHIDLTDFCERRWDKVASAGIYAEGDFVRPTPARRTGYEYEATAGGQVGVVEPAWPTTIGATVQDGSIEWTCREISNDSLAKTVLDDSDDEPVWDGDGFEVSEESVVNGDGRQAVRCFITEPSDGIQGKKTVQVLVTFSDGHVENFGVEVKA